MKRERRARLDESREALAGLADAPFRAARRTGNDPVSLTTIGTMVSGFRARIDTAQSWLDSSDPPTGRLYRQVVAHVEADVAPKLKRALEPDERTGPERTADGSFAPSPPVRTLVRLWSRTVAGGPAAWAARRLLERRLATHSEVVSDGDP